MWPVIACLVVFGCSTPGASPAQQTLRISDPMELAPRREPREPAVLRETEVHVFGTYETVTSRGFREHRRGTVTVNLERTAPQVLVLSAYEPTRWVIAPAPGAQLRAVIVSGYHAHQVEAPRSARIINLSGDGRYLAASGNPGDGSGLADNAAGLIAGVEGYLGAPVSSYHGCYRATAVTQTASGRMTADCTDGYDRNLREVPIDSARPELPPIVRSYVMFRAGLLARCGTWNAATCAAEGAIVVVDKAARDAGTSIDGAPVTGPRPLKLTGATQITVENHGRISQVPIAAGSITRISGPDADTSQLRGRGQLTITGDPQVVPHVGRAAGGSMCMGTSCTFGRDANGMFFLLDWLASSPLSGIAEIALAGQP